MRLVLILLALSGCDSVFGFDPPPIDAPPADMAPAGPVAIKELTISSEVVTAETADLHATFLGTAGDTVSYSFGAQGEIDAKSGMVELDGTGAAQLTAHYTAPPAPGPDLVSLHAREAVASLMIDVLVLDAFGFDQVYATNGTVPKDTLLGTRLPLVQPGTIRSLGVHVSFGASGVHDGRFALYRGDALAPGTLIATTESVALVQGRNVIPLVAPIHISDADDATYWVLGVYDQSVLVGSNSLNNAVSYSAAMMFASTFPPAITAHTATDALGFAYFVEVAHPAAQ